MNKYPYIEIQGLNKKLNLSKITEVKVKRNFMEIEELPDGTYRLIYSTPFIDDITRVTGFNLVRIYE